MTGATSADRTGRDPPHERRAFSRLGFQLELAAPRFGTPSQVGEPASALDRFREAQPVVANTELDPVCR